MNTDESFRYTLGTVMRLNSGGFVMTITKRTPGLNEPRYLCVWHTPDGMPQTAEYTESALKRG